MFSPELIISEIGGHILDGEMPDVGRYAGRLKLLLERSSFSLWGSQRLAQVYRNYSDPVPGKWGNSRNKKCGPFWQAAFNRIGESH